MGRLEKVAPPRDRRGHLVRLRGGGRIRDSTTTDGSGRFLLEWRPDGHDEESVVELVDGEGVVSESVRLSYADLVSPPVVIFTGEAVLGVRPFEEDTGTGPVLEAEGDHPICVVSACQSISLAWSCPSGSRTAILWEGGETLDGLPNRGAVVLQDARTRKYTIRNWRAGGGEGDFSAKSVEIRRYRSLSLVIDGVSFETGDEVEFGVSTSCPAGRDGLIVEVQSSDVEMVTGFQVTIPEGARWATTRVILGRKSGEVKVTAYATGYTRDGVDIRIDQGEPTATRAE